MTMQTQAATLAPIQPPKPEPTLYKVLRDHSLGELQNQDAETLRAYKAILAAKTEEITRRMTTTNLFITQVDDLRADIRCYTMIQTEIDAYLAREFHSK
ncbi:hypothetical protein [Spirosoma aerolatum]|uniref:hypothetical protein n=1 Tax=Spirosoma aerolatum TaxID=1211326 RepID=UPI0009AE8C00|nr:hypothetical protein [Spirosoma aerolatum]